MQSANIPKEPPFLTESFASLMQFVSKNTAVELGIQSIQHHTKEILQLEQAIERADFHDPIFSNTQCDLYLLYLIKHPQNHQINYWQCISIYFHLIALSEFTDKKPISLPIKVDNVKREIEMVPMIDTQGKLTETGDQYIDYLIDKVKLYEKISLSKHTLIEKIKSLPRSERCLQFISIVKDGTGFDTLIEQVAMGNPLYSKINFIFSFRPDAKHICMPSFSFINFMFSQVAVRPIILLPIFGKVSSKTLFKLHKNNLHPVPLFCSRVKSNYTIVHQLITSLVAITWHDLLHANWSCLLDNDLREKIVNEMIPDLSALSEDEKFVLPKQKQAIEKVFNELNDFNLVADIFNNKDLRSQNYLNHANIAKVKTVFYHPLAEAIVFYCAYVRKCHEVSHLYSLNDLLFAEEKIFEIHPNIKVIIESRQGNLEEVTQALIQMNFYQNHSVQDDNRFLLFAAYEGDSWEDIQRLTQQGANINVLDGSGNSLIHRAVIKLNWDMLTKLLDLGINVDLKNREGQTVLDLMWQWANYNVSFYTIIIFLIGKNASYTDKMQKHGEILQAYINSPYLRDKANPLIIERLFAEYDADQLHLNDSIPAIQKLLDAAVINLRFDAVLMIYKKCPNFLALAKVNHAKLFFESMDIKFTELAMYLLTQKIVSGNIKDEEGNTGLHYAARHGNIKLAHLLIEYNVDVDAVNNRGEKAADLASKKFVSQINLTDSSRSEMSLGAFLFFKTVKIANRSEPAILLTQFNIPRKSSSGY